MISTSPERGSFQINSELKQVEQGEKTAESAEEMIEFYKSANQLRREREQAPEWAENNLEHDLRSTDWILAKTRASEAYAQNLYAAMCNNDFQRNDVWPVLKNETWSASWRYAGGIIADMLGKGDYMDWYCSGIQGDSDTETMTAEQLERHQWYKANFVGESVVTDEIRADLLKLGWLVVDSDPDISI
jgi:hypothetical protein